MSRGRAPVMNWLGDEPECYVPPSSGQLRVNLAAYRAIGEPDEVTVDADPIARTLTISADKSATGKPVAVHRWTNSGWGATVHPIGCSLSCATALHTLGLVGPAPYRRTDLARPVYKPRVEGKSLVIQVGAPATT